MGVQDPPQVAGFGAVGAQGFPACPGQSSMGLCEPAAGSWGVTGATHCSRPKLSGAAAGSTQGSSSTWLPSMAPVLPWGLAAAAPVGFLLLLFLCAFCPRASGRFSTQSTAGNSGLVTLSGPDCRDGEGALLGGASPCSRTDITSEGNTDISGSPHPNTSPKSSPRTPDFLRHRQLPLLPGDTAEPAVDTVQDAQGPIYESIRYKSQKLSAGLEKPYRDDLDSGDDGDPVQRFVVQEEPCSPGSPIPVYARICKVSRAPQHTVPNSIEPEEEAAPALPEKRFDIL
ncbi:uncharacterized protein LOC104910023 isoform X2 [Meleagris gallopavo]|uniref:uncharacterized protein LOC104910023 isoform X2 n=1 Tax=Meleagris gallopavo TaxID=9103 RepID=UPI000939FC1D|nr:uncharacterized protein LOC104910023 isoform X2 [Meleagris gallopavo]